MSIADYNKAIEIDPDDKDAYYNLGDTYVSLSNYNTDHWNYTVQCMTIAARLGASEAQKWLDSNCS
ncbi:tetratricopeptide repeat protein [Dysgonomonas reticulitermitis]